MEDLQNISFEKLLRIYRKYFSLNFISYDINDKLALIALTCYVTNELKKKNKNITCYDVLLKIGKEETEYTKNTFLKSLGAICEDLSYACTSYPDFGLKFEEMPKTIKRLLGNMIPF